MAVNKYHAYNQFTQLPFIPYNIIKLLTTSEQAEGLFKLLKYNTYDALSEPNLTFREKMDLIWKDNATDAQNYRIFLSNIDPSMLPEAITIMKCYRAEGKPDNLTMSTEIYRFDFIFGTKIPLVDYEGVPCNRGDLMEMFLHQSLNGTAVSGTSFFEYTTRCASRNSLGDNEKFTGLSVLMSTKIGQIE